MCARGCGRVYIPVHVCTSACSCGECMYMHVCVRPPLFPLKLGAPSSPILNDPLHNLVCGNPVTTVHHLQNTHPLGHLQTL